MHTRSGDLTNGRSALAGFCAAALAALAAGCVPQVVSEVLTPRDLSPPGVTAWDSTGPREYVIQFNETVDANPVDFSADPDLGAVEVFPEGFSLRIAVSAAAGPGAPISLEGTVRDAADNSTSFVLPFWGYNPDLPRVLFNEILTQGSSTHPDVVELAVLEPGNLAGLTFRVGCAEFPVLRYIFPSCAAAAGEFIVLHLKPQGIPAETDETGDTAVSGGLDAYPYARDFWYPGSDGALPGENGVLTLYASPTGPLQDALIYSARTSESDTRYGGFGSQALRNQARSVVKEG
ncbi:MAG TPA: hypothetical protein VLH39_06845, partial [Magnetospirillaceae bacterium]|nr:hypothetical protein [Magnetospirillaceae bacterium]